MVGLRPVGAEEMERPPEKEEEGPHDALAESVAELRAPRLECTSPVANGECVTGGVVGELVDVEATRDDRGDHPLEVHVARHAGPEMAAHEGSVGSAPPMREEVGPDPTLGREMSAEEARDPPEAGDVPRRAQDDGPVTLTV